MIKRIILATFMAVALTAGVTAQAAPPPSKQVVALKRENSALRAQVKRLKADLAKATKAAENASDEADAQRAIADDAKARAADFEGRLATTVAERDQARAALAAAQMGVAGAISTLSTPEAWQLLRPISTRFNSSVWQASYYVSGDYESWTFTRCGFCA